MKKKRKWDEKKYVAALQRVQRCADDVCYPISNGMSLLTSVKRLEKALEAVPIQEKEHK